MLSPGMPIFTGVSPCAKAGAAAAPSTASQAASAISRNRFRMFNTPAPAHRR